MHLTYAVIDRSRVDFGILNQTLERLNHLLLRLMQGQQLAVRTALQGLHHHFVLLQHILVLFRLGLLVDCIASKLLQK